MATQTQLLLPWQQRNLRHALYMNKRRNRRQRPEIHKCCNEVSALILLVMRNSWLFPFVFETARALSIWKDCRLFRLQADLWELYENFTRSLFDQYGTVYQIACERPTAPDVRKRASYIWQRCRAREKNNITRVLLLPLYSFQRAFWSFNVENEGESCTFLDSRKLL